MGEFRLERCVVPSVRMITTLLSYQFRTQIGVPALRSVGTSNPVFASVESSHGTRYVVDGLLTTPVNRSPRVRTVWILEAGSAAPRLVTAYPLEDRL